MIHRPSLILGLAFVLGTGSAALAAPCPATMPVAGEFSSGFGSRHGRPHPGVDIRAPMGTPVVALFGPSGERQWGPWRVAHRVVESGHPCRPCGNDGCGGSKVSECLTGLPVDRVHSAINELLAQP